MPRIALCVLLLLASAAAPTLAQGPPGGCNQAAAQEPATKPAPASNDGTAPGNSGSSGWSGGLGGSFVGTAPAGTQAGKPQPATAQGLDLKGRAANC